MQVSNDPGAANWQRTNAILAVSSLLVVAWVYRSLPRVFFSADDFINLYQIANRPALDYVMEPFGGHLLATRNAVFLAFQRIFGPRPEPFFTAALLTHLVNVALLFRVISRLTNNAYIAALGAIAWGINPAHAGSLGWYSVYGQVLVGTILLLLLDRATCISRAGASLPFSAAAVWPLLLLLAATSFGVGIAITVVSPLVFFLVLPPSRQRTTLCVTLTALVIAMPLLYLASDPTHAAAAGLPNIRFGLADSLRSAIYYWDLTGTMLAYLVAYGTTTLVLSFAFFPDVLPSPVATVAAALATVAVIVAFVRSDSQTRRWLAALTLLALASYGLIAVGRSIYFRIDQMGAAAASARYHYAATIPLAALLCLALARIGVIAPANHSTRAALAALWSAAIVFAYLREGPFLDLHERERHEVATVIRQIDALIDSADSDTVYIANKRFVSVGFFINKRPTIFPGWVAIYAIFHPSRPEGSKHVYFVADDPKLVEALSRDRRSTELLVAADQVPPGVDVLTPAALLSGSARTRVGQSGPLNAAP